MKPLLLVFVLTGFSLCAQHRYQYSGVPFDDADWGKSYKTSATDRNIIASIHKALAMGFDNIQKNPGNYNILPASDMAFVIDEQKVKEAETHGRCGTCYYSMSPLLSEHFQYSYSFYLDLQEDSEDYRLYAKYNDSISTQLINQLELKRNEAGDATLQHSMNIYEETVNEFMKDGKLSETELVELERISSGLRSAANEHAQSQSLDPENVRNLKKEMASMHIRLEAITNKPMIEGEKKLFQSMNGNTDYDYREIDIPGFTFACIYFDRKGNTEWLPYAETFTFYAYCGRTYLSKDETPKDWISPYCVSITASGNNRQLQEIIKKIDFPTIASICR